MKPWHADSDDDVDNASVGWFDSRDYEGWDCE